MTIEKLFFELLQVSLGQLDCLTRGPSPEEWHELYNMARRQHVLPLGYQGLQRLFEFGLRAPQDVSIDWMADAEEASEQEAPSLAVDGFDIGNPLRRIFYNRWVKSNAGSLYLYNPEGKKLTPQAAVVVLLAQSYELFNRGQLTLAPLVGLYSVLSECGGKPQPFRTGATPQQVLRKLGIWRFSCSVMWVLGEVLAVKPNRMLCKPNAAGGQFVLHQIMTDHSPFVERIRHSVLRFLKF
jgi:hypothetical protein